MLLGLKLPVLLLMLNVDDPCDENPRDDDACDEDPRDDDTCDEDPRDDDACDEDPRDDDACDDPVHLNLCNVSPCGSLIHLFAYCNTSSFRIMKIATNNPCMQLTTSSTKLMISTAQGSLTKRRNAKGTVKFIPSKNDKTKVARASRSSNKSSPCIMCPK